MTIDKNISRHFATKSDIHSTSFPNAHEVVKAWASVRPKTPEKGALEGVRPLPCLSDHNGDKKWSKNGKATRKQTTSTPKSKVYKTKKSLTQNCNYFAKLYGIERLGLFTATFKENLTDGKEASRRWKNLNDTYRRAKKWKLLARVAETQARGAIHYHCLVLLEEDIRTGFDFEAHEECMNHKHGTNEYKKLNKRRTASASRYLRHLWAYGRQKAQSHGFGRCSLEPIRYPNNLGNYLGKYLCKEFEVTERGGSRMEARVRKISYGKHRKPYSSNFSWLNGNGGLWRKRLVEWSAYRGFHSTDHIASRYGPRWSYHLYGEIMFDTVRMQREADGLPSLASTGHIPFSPRDEDTRTNIRQRKFERFIAKNKASLAKTNDPSEQISYLVTRPKRRVEAQAEFEHASFKAAFCD